MSFDQACPSCGTGMPSGAVLCTACGFHTVTGKRMAVDVGYAQKKRPGSGPPTTLQQVLYGLIKPFFLIVIFGGLGLVGWRMVTWLNHNPNKHQQETIAKWAVGMTMQQIVDAAGEEPTNTYIWKTKMEKTNDGEKE